ncbi:N-acetylmuramoyl-L-alanine amidase [Clostridium tetani]|uniref:N-acetylmuramoyl-L-alanine amidase n=1 Tax=Clostridium tetani TaxID=1513 RepID=UPI0024A9BF40|nr:N-acetylmuramoyl-L-alanine amidase [Clostridium tetani]
MKKYKNAITFSIMFLFLLLLPIVCKVKAADDFKIIPTKQNVEQNKKWIIKFNDILKISTVNNDTIYVTDEKGKRVQTNLEVGADKKSIYVSPKLSYEYGKTYFLIANKGIQRLSGRSMATNVKMKFIIKNNGVVPPVNGDDLVVCLDAGRGGSDKGNVGPSGSLEKDINLDVALKAGSILENTGMKVVYTRKDDNIKYEENDLKSRFQVIDVTPVDAIVSIYCNIAANSDATGIETFYKEGDINGKNLADKIQGKLSSYTGMRNRGVKTGNFKEIYAVDEPIVKIFLGFINNPEDEKKLNDSSMQEKLGKAIADGIIDYAKGSSNGGNNITIASVEDIIKSVAEGEKYNLPSKVNVKTIQGESKEESIIWNSTIVDTSKVGTYAYKGKVEGYPKEVILTLLVTNKGNGKHIVCIDPGHGGYDSGAVGPTGIKEKDIALKVAQKTGKILENKGVKVVYTRTSDKVSWPSSVELDLKKRTEIANSMNPNYFVSIHCNSANNIPFAKGTETYYSRGSVLGQKLATNVQKELIKNLGTINRGTKTANFYVIRNSNSPAILAELEFISNTEGEQNLNNEEFQDKCAQSIANGILKSLGVLN